MKTEKFYRFFRYHFFKINWYKTIYINFRKLSFKDALKFPILVYGKIQFKSLSGKINILCDVKTGLIKIGDENYINTSISKSVWSIYGNLNFNGNARFMNGTFIFVIDTAELSFGEDNFVGSNGHILCYDKISLSRNVRIAWDCNLYDTNFHYIENLKDNSVNDITAPISIGENTWIGNRSTISKGVILPSDTIVASNSLVNKDFSDIPKYSIIAGSPANLKAYNKRRIYDEELELFYDNKYGHIRRPM